MSMDDWMEKKGIGRQFNWFWYFVDLAKNAFEFNNSSFQACIGKRRSGKSVWCLGAACAVDPDFSEEQICFGLNELKSQLNEKQKTSVIWEEAGVSAYSRDFMQERNKLIVKTLQVYGYRRIALFGNFQHLKYLDVDVRLQLDCFFKMKAFNTFENGEPVTHTFSIPYAIVTDWIQDPLISPYKVEREGVFQAIGQIPVPPLWDFFEVCNVTKNLYKNYLKKKDEYFQELDPEPEEKEEIFTKRELKTLTRINQAYINLASKLISDDKITKVKIASMSDIPISTLNVWLKRAEEAEYWINRVSEEETTAKTFFELH